MLIKLDNVLIPISIAAIAILLLGGFSFDFIGYREQHYSLNKTVLVFSMLLPSLLFLLVQRDFWQTRLHRMIVVWGLAGFFVALHFNFNFCYVFSIVFGVIALLNVAIERRLHKPNTLFILFAAYFAVNLISWLWTSDPKAGAKQANLLLAFIYIPLGFSMIGVQQRELTLIFRSIARWLLFFAVVSVCSWILQCRAYDIPLQDALALIKRNWDIYKPYEIVYAWNIFNHPTYIAFSLCFGLVLYFFYTKRGDFSLLELIFYSIVIAWLSLITQSRVMLVMWLMINSAGVVYLLKGRKSRLVVAAIFVLVAVFSAIAFRTQVMSFIADPVRKMHYQVAMQAISENGLQGTGLGGMTKYINWQNPLYIGFLEETFTHAHPHNQFLGDLMQSGVLGLLVTLAIVFYLIYIGVRQRSWIVLGTTAILLLLMMIEMPMFYGHGLYFVVLILSLVVQHKTDIITQ